MGSTLPRVKQRSSLGWGEGNQRNPTCSILRRPSGIYRRVCTAPPRCRCTSYNVIGCLSGISSRSLRRLGIQIGSSMRSWRDRRLDVLIDLEEIRWVVLVLYRNQSVVVLPVRGLDSVVFSGAHEIDVDSARHQRFYVFPEGSHPADVPLALRCVYPRTAYGKIPSRNSMWICQFIRPNARVCAAIVLGRDLRMLRWDAPCVCAEGLDYVVRQILDEP